MSRTFQRGCKNKSIGISSAKTFESSGFSKCRSINKKAFSEGIDFQCTSSGETQMFCKELAKSKSKPSNLELRGKLQDAFIRDTIPEVFSTSMINEVGGKNDCKG